jgi:hypothetical protein
MHITISDQYSKGKRKATLCYDRELQVCTIVPGSAVEFIPQLVTIAKGLGAPVITGSFPGADIPPTWEPVPGMFYCSRRL